jgi:hypothetical protein
MLLMQMPATKKLHATALHLVGAAKDLMHAVAP